LDGFVLDGFVRGLGLVGFWVCRVWLRGLRVDLCLDDGSLLKGLDEVIEPRNEDVLVALGQVSVLDVLLDLCIATSEFACLGFEAGR
jgi:hypothetical protein